MVGKLEVSNRSICGVVPVPFTGKKMHYYVFMSVSEKKAELAIGQYILTDSFHCKADTGKQPFQFLVSYIKVWCAA